MKIIPDMKRLFGLAGLVILFAVSCEQYKVESSDVLPIAKSDVKVYASIEQPASPDTKVYADQDLKVLWHANDTISFFNKLTLNEKWMFTGETGDNAGYFEQLATLVGTGNDMDYYCAVYPYQKSTKISNQDVMTVTLPATQKYAENSFGQGANTMVAVSSSTIFSFKNVCGYLAFKLYGEGVSVSSITLKGNADEPLAGAGTIPMAVDSLPIITMTDAATKEITLVCDSPVALGSSAEDYTEFWMVVPPTVFASGFTITIRDASGMAISKKLSTSLEIERSKIRRMAPFAVVMPVTTYEAVDLGLSVKWATFNVGASSPEEYGDYFAWGETEPKSDYLWAYYKWCNGTKNSLTKYNHWTAYGTVDNKKVLDPEDDAAHVNWGGSWRMPTDAEWTELRNNCTWTWTTVNGIKGRLVTSKKAGYTDKSIFLPAAGRRSGTDLTNVGSYGIYWSSSLYTDNPDYAWYVSFDSDNVGRYDYFRFLGQSIRPISE